MPSPSRNLFSARLIALRGRSEPLHEVFELYCVECHLRHYNGLCWAVRYIFTVM